MCQWTAIVCVFSFAETSFFKSETFLCELPQLFCTGYVSVNLWLADARVYVAQYRDTRHFDVPNIYVLIYLLNT